MSSNCVTMPPSVRCMSVILRGDDVTTRDRVAYIIQLVEQFVDAWLHGKVLPELYVALFDEGPVNIGERQRFIVARDQQRLSNSGPMSQTIDSQACRSHQAGRAYSSPRLGFQDTHARMSISVSFMSRKQRCDQPVMHTGHDLRLAFAVSRRHSGHSQSMTSDGSDRYVGSAPQQHPVSVVHKNLISQLAQINRRDGDANMTNEVERSNILTE